MLLEYRILNIEYSKLAFFLPKDFATLKKTWGKIKSTKSYLITFRWTDFLNSVLLPYSKFMIKYF